MRKPKVGEDKKKIIAYNQAFRKAFDYYSRYGKFNLYQLQKAANILGIKIEDAKL